MESNGLKVNMEKTKLMVTGKSRHRIQSGRWPCNYCGKGVGVNSILCVECKKWCHQRCSGLKKVSEVRFSASILQKRHKWSRRSDRIDYYRMENRES